MRSQYHFLLLFSGSLLQYIPVCAVHLHQTVLRNQDRVQQAKELIDRYETQLKLYADVLERVFGARKLKVKEILIYSFSLEKLITL